MSLKPAGLMRDGIGSEVTVAASPGAQSYVPDEASQGLISGDCVDSAREIFPEETGDLDCRGYGWGV